MRPSSLDDFVGQGRTRRAQLASSTHDRTGSDYVDDPVGDRLDRVRRTLASVIASTTNSDFVKLSAVTSGHRRTCAPSPTGRRKNRTALGKRTILFIDEIHRFNKAQQDAFLPGCRGRHDYAHRRHDRKTLPSPSSAPLLSRATCFRAEGVKRLRTLCPFSNGRCQMSAMALVCCTCRPLPSSCCRWRNWLMAMRDAD